MHYNLRIPKNPSKFLENADNLENIIPPGTSEITIVFYEVSNLPRELFTEFLNNQDILNKTTSIEIFFSNSKILSHREKEYLCQWLYRLSYLTYVDLRSNYGYLSCDDIFNFLKGILPRNRLHHLYLNDNEINDDILSLIQSNMPLICLDLSGMTYIETSKDINKTKDYKTNGEENKSDKKDDYKTIVQDDKSEQEKDLFQNGLERLIYFIEHNGHSFSNMELCSIPKLNDYFSIIYFKEIFYRYPKYIHNIINILHDIDRNIEYKESIFYSIFTLDEHGHIHTHGYRNKNSHFPKNREKLKCVDFRELSIGWTFGIFIAPVNVLSRKGGLCQIELNIEGFDILNYWTYFTNIFKRDMDEMDVDSQEGISIGDKQKESVLEKQLLSVGVNNIDSSTDSENNVPIDSSTNSENNVSIDGSTDALLSENTHQLIPGTFVVFPSTLLYKCSDDIFTCENIQNEVPHLSILKSLDVKDKELINNINDQTSLNNDKKSLNNNKKSLENANIQKPSNNSILLFGVVYTMDDNFISITTTLPSEYDTVERGETMVDFYNTIIFKNSPIVLSQIKLFRQYNPVFRTMELSTPISQDQIKMLFSPINNYIYESSITRIIDPQDKFEIYCKPPKFKSNVLVFRKAGKQTNPFVLGFFKCIVYNAEIPYIFPFNWNVHFNILNAFYINKNGETVRRQMILEKDWIDQRISDSLLVDYSSCISSSNTFNFIKQIKKRKRQQVEDKSTSPVRVKKKVKIKENISSQKQCQNFSINDFLYRRVLLFDGDSLLKPVYFFSFVKQENNNNNTSYQNTDNNNTQENTDNNHNIQENNTIQSTNDNISTIQENTNDTTIHETNTIPRKEGCSQKENTDTIFTPQYYCRLTSFPLKKSESSLTSTEQSDSIFRRYSGQTALFENVYVLNIEEFLKIVKCDVPSKLLEENNQRIISKYQGYLMEKKGLYKYKGLSTQSMTLNQLYSNILSQQDRIHVSDVSSIPGAGRGVFNNNSIIKNQEIITIYFGHLFGNFDRLCLEEHCNQNNDWSNITHCKPLTQKLIYTDGLHRNINCFLSSNCLFKDKNNNKDVQNKENTDDLNKENTHSRDNMENTNFDSKNIKYPIIPVGQLVNHSATPNATFSTLSVTGGYLDNVKFPICNIMCVRAIRDILPGEEIFVNYGVSYWDLIRKDPN